MNEDKQNILAKIKKLWALADKAKNNSEAEAEAAARKAMAFMEEHNIEMGEVHFKERASEVLKGDKVDGFNTKKLWRLYCCHCVCLISDVQFLVYSDGGLCFVGFPEDVVIAKENLDYLSKLGARAYKEKSSSVSKAEYSKHRPEWLYGFFYGLLLKLKEDVAKKAQEAVNSTAIVLVKTDAITEFVNALSTRKSRKRSSGNVGSAFSEGCAIGKNTTLNKQVR